MGALTRGPEAPHARLVPLEESRRVARDSLWVAVGGQLERVLGILTALALRWGLAPESMGVYTGLRLYLDNTNRSSLGVGLGAVQEIPILRASGREEEARLVANVAHTTNTLTCLVYAAMLVAWALWRSASGSTGSLDAEWTWGLMAVAGLALIKRYETFLVAVLRAHREFVLTTELDLVEALASALAVTLGLLVAGFWGLLGAVGVLLLCKIAYAHARHPFRFTYAWHGPTAWRLMRVGLPILANTAVFGTVVGLDRFLILWRVPEGERAVGLYSVALIGAGWALDLAGRIVLVSYTSFQTVLGQTGDAREVARRTARATEAQAPILLLGSAFAYLAGPAALGIVLPRYAEGLPALRPLLPGMVLLGLAWPARQMSITLGLSTRLFLTTLVGLGVTFGAGVVGADAAGIVGVAWGMTIGYASVFLLTSASALIPLLGARAFVLHLCRLGWHGAGIGSATLLAAHGAIGGASVLAELAARGVVLVGLILLFGWVDRRRRPRWLAWDDDQVSDGLLAFARRAGVRLRGDSGSSASNASHGGMRAS